MPYIFPFFNRSLQVLTPVFHKDTLISPASLSSTKRKRLFRYLGSWKPFIWRRDSQFRKSCSFPVFPSLNQTPHSKGRCWLHFSWVIQDTTNNDQRITKEESTNWNLSLSMPGWIIVYSLLLMFVLKTVHRNSEWQTKERLARSGLKVNPTNAKIHVTLGNFLANKVCINKNTSALRSRQVGRLRRIKRPSGHISTESCWPLFSSLMNPYPYSTADVFKRIIYFARPNNVLYN